MKSEFSIVEYLCGPKATIYTIECKGEINEVERFFDRFLESHKREVKKIAYKLDHMVKRTGCEDHLFKPIASKMDAVEEIKEGNLRLFVLRYSKVAIVIGGGDLKNTRKYQDVPSLKELATFMSQLSITIDTRIKEKEIIWNGDKLDGNLEFNKSI